MNYLAQGCINLVVVATNLQNGLSLVFRIFLFQKVSGVYSEQNKPRDKHFLSKL